MKLVRIAWALCAAGSALLDAQSWDTSGNGLLNGNYYFREVFITSSAAVSLYGNIVFSGNGTYTINAVGLQCTTSCGLSNYTTSGTYSIASSGFGFLSNGLLSDLTYGSVGANGVFVGSSTESGVNELFIAAPVSGQSTSTLSGSYAISYLTPNLFSQSAIPYSALMQFSANGGGAIGNVSLAAYQASATPFNQTIGGVKYRVSNNAFVVTFPNSNTNLLVGDEYFYSTPDGSFVFGGSPQDFDMLVGVRTGSGTSAALSGLYYEAGFDFNNADVANGNIYQDTFYGSFVASQPTIVGHQRIQDGTSVYGWVYHDAYPIEAGSTYTDLSRSLQFIVANGVRVGLGLGPFPSLNVAVQARQLTPSGAMFLNPTSAVNLASAAPFTSGISSGELLSLAGTGLGPDRLEVAGTTPLPTTLAGVQVLLNNRPVPLLSVSATRIVMQVPYQTLTPTALIQVTYKGVSSNTISTLVNSTTPGVFTLPAGGVNHASARHANGTLVTTANPAKVGETVTMYLTGIGDLKSNVVDGGVGPVGSPAKPANTIAVFIGGVAVTPSFLALAPGLVGLVQLSVAIPAGVTTGDVFVEVAGPDSDSIQATLAVSAATTGAVQTRRAPQRLYRRPWSPPAIAPRDGRLIEWPR